MKRRTALVTAGVVTVVLLAAAAAVAVNLGVLGVATAAGPVGELTATDLAHSVTIQQPADNGQAGPAGATSGGVDGGQPGDGSGGVEDGDDREPGTGQVGHYEGREDDD
jgi:uncharacterized low-complexity protein